MSEIKTPIVTLGGYPLADTEARKDIIALSEEIVELNAGTRDTELEFGLMVGYARPDENPNTPQTSAPRITLENIIVVRGNVHIVCGDVPGYQWAVATFDEFFTRISTTGWVGISDMTLKGADCAYVAINFKRTDNASCTQDDVNILLNGIRLVNKEAVYIKSINGVLPDSNGNFDLLNVPESSAEVTIINGVSNGHTGAFEYSANNRATTKDFISVINGGRIVFTGGTTYNYSPIRLTSDMEEVGYMGWIADAKFELNYTGYLKFNIQRKDGGDMNAAELAEITKILKVYPQPIDDPVSDYKAELRADLMNSITLEFNRKDGASYQLVRIPMTTNDGRKVRPVVRLTSEDGSLDGEKCSTLDYAKREKTAFAMNAGLFDVATAKPLGQTIIDGVSIVNTPHPQGANGETISETECYPLCIDADGWLSAPYSKTVDTAQMIEDGIVQATTGWVKLVENYEIQTDEIASEIVHPQPYVQNVIGQFDNGDYIVCSVSNKGYGSSAPNDNGLTYTQVAQIMVDKGVKFAYALDGGGSAQTVLGMRHINPIYEGTAGRAIPSVIVFVAK